MTATRPSLAFLGSRHVSVVGASEAVDRLRTAAPSLAEAEWAPSLSLLAKRQNGTPQLIVVGLEHPDQFSQQEVDNLLSSLPLARIVCCAFEWNASLHRSRPRWPIASTIALAGLEARLRWESEVLQGSSPPIPATAGREEAAFAFLPPLPLFGTRSVAVLSPDIHFSRLLRDALRSVDCAISDVSSAHAILLDLDPGAGTQVSGCAELRTEFSGLIIGLTGDPIPEQTPGARCCDQLCSKAEPLSSWLEALATSLQAD
jgi:hypothetical protein